MTTSSEQQKLIVVTGFGPFLGHEEINASWEAVQLLPDLLHFNGVDYIIRRQLVPVEYKGVDQTVNQIWQLKPDLVVHCGVSGIAKCVQVEKLAYNHQFRRPDNAGELLENGTICLTNNGNINVLRCGLDVDKIVKVVNETCSECTTTTTTSSIQTTTKPTKASKNVGSFLCGYIYLSSLDVNRKRSLFVHVPPIDKPFSSAQTAEILYKIIEECISQLSSCEQSF